MTPQKRKKLRPITVKRNILGCIRAIRGTRHDIAKYGFEFSNRQGGLIASETSLIKQLNTFLTERKSNKWTN